ncbi:uncharacterized protein BDZ99DRAFT_573110 [Mytilinidion resinicola]|uniref:Zn(2)-C6 fungal-type domain-containing protein n=1 Tax=Mytilinidion resinicola TaxID=574789 RepID=A0A6A6YEJ3_9PEZI|nr:uncharacterized protein BDZ99DRAFT_573110 [Mytilinidion resinicola]KAF2807241.1 hypothetical protein BDZ99DRAFT_573110 [Mytilinidion resinicola]
MTRTGFPARLRMSHESRKLNTSYRRNGKLQSCEPCRKGKLRCDHMTPTCGRCARRNKSDQCVYHPAPLTKGLPTPQSSLSVTSNDHFDARSNEQFEPLRSIEQFELQSNQHFEPRSNGFNSDLTTTSLSGAFDNSSNFVAPRRQFRANSLPAQPHRSRDVRDPSQRQMAWGVPADLQRSAEYLGATPYSAVLDENEMHLNFPPAQTIVPSSVAALSKVHIRKGAEILSLLKDMSLFEKLINYWMTLSHGYIVIAPMMKIWTSSLWAVHHRALETQKPEALLKMAETISLNTIKPLRFDGKTTPREFAASCTGEQLRWEVVGIVFAAVGVVLMSLMDGNPLFYNDNDEPIDRKQLALKVWDASESCLSFCNDFDILNDVFLWLLFENYVLSNSLHSKGSYANWQKSGEINNALLAFGLHQEIKVDADTPFFIAEFRKRLFVQAYGNDKSTAAFVGRPPRLSHQYCLLQLPLDLSDEQLMADGLDLSDALTCLDEEGWNSRGTISACTWARICAHNARIYEDILEISLGVLDQDIVAKAHAIEQKAQSAWDRLPSHLRVNSENPWDLKRAPVEHIFLYGIQLEHLDQRFLIQRALIKKANVDATRLVLIAREMFRHILVVVNNRDAVHDFHLDFTQGLCTHGIPVAAVIAVELLRQERNPGTTADPLPRSATIQDLSVFVACLGTIRPDCNAYNICDRGRRFLKSILDTILSPAPYCISSNSGGSDVHDLPAPQFAGNDGEFMRWLETMDWEQDSWINFD